MRLWFTVPAPPRWILEPDLLLVSGIHLWPSATRTYCQKSNSTALQIPPSRTDSLCTDSLWIDKRTSVRCSGYQGSWNLSEWEAHWRERATSSYLCSQMQDRFPAPGFLESMFLLQKSQIFQQFSKFFIWLQGKQNIANMILWSVDDCQVNIKLKFKKKHDPVKMLANVVNVDQLTCEIPVFSCQLLQILHGLKIEICWFYRTKSINKRKTHKQTWWVHAGQAKETDICWIKVLILTSKDQTDDSSSQQNSQKTDGEFEWRDRRPSFVHSFLRICWTNQEFQQAKYLSINADFISWFVGLRCFWTSCNYKDQPNGNNATVQQFPDCINVEKIPREFTLWCMNLNKYHSSLTQQCFSCLFSNFNFSFNQLFFLSHCLRKLQTSNAYNYTHGKPVQT